MSKPKVFISYSHVDEKRWKNRLQKHLKVLERHGSLGFWDDRRIAAGQEWRAEIESALDSADAAILLVSPDFLSSNFINDEEVPVILQRRISDGMKVFPLIVRSCPWQKVPWLEPLQTRPIDGKPLAQFRGDDIDRILSELVNEIESLLNQPQPKTPAATEPHTSMAAQPADECPYLGLEAFTEDKEHLFFGREDFADALFDKVKRQNFVALIGPSGCGKSSVVQAGLFPRLRRDTQAWAINFFQPQENPFLSLAAEFIKHWQPQASSSAFINQTAKLAAELKNTQRLIEAIQRTVAAPDGRLLLVVDQFEEMFTLCDESARRVFLDMLLEIKDVAPVTILFTLRVDFMGQAQSFSPAFSQLLDESIVSHRPLTRAGLEAIIIGPARYAGLEFEPGLVALILQEVAAQSDSLPLLEYTLKEMWRNRQSRVMGHALYEAVGKVEGAISQHADAVLHSLPEAEQVLALRALTRLVRVAGEEGEADTRLRLPLSELPEVERDVLQTFVTARLLVTKREEGAGAETIEVSHEALIHRWEKLREALDSDREFLMWRRRLASRRKLWEQKGRDDKWLLYGGDRDDAQRWLNERGAELIAAEIEFITWDDRPDFQIKRILSDGPGLLLFLGGEIRKSWLATLALYPEKEKALSIAREIEDASSRSKALSSISEALARSGMAAEALAVAGEIEDARNRADVLSSISEALARSGMAAEARKAATEALATAREIEDAGSRAKALRSISEGLANAGMAAEALTAAHEIEDARSRAKALRSISEGLANAGMAAEALAAAGEIEDAGSRAGALRSISGTLARVGMATEARKAATEALAAAGEIESAHYRADVLRSISEALANAGMVTEALAAAREIEDTYYRASVLSSISEALVEAGGAAEARKETTEALAAAGEIEDAGSRAGALRSISEALARVGMATEARKAAAEALAAAGEIESAHYRADVLRSISEALPNAGMATEALAAAGEIKDAGSRAKALSSISEALAEAGVSAEARKEAAEALAAAGEIEDAGSRAGALRSISEALARVGMAAEARKAAAEALAAAGEIESAHYQADALSSISEALARSGMATEALAAAREIEDTYYRASVLSSISEALARSGMAAEALAAAGEIEDAGSRADVLSSISEALARLGVSAEARKAATEALAAFGEIEDAHNRAGALRSISEALTRAGMATEAREAATEALTAAREIEDAGSRAKALRSISEGLANAGMATEALTAAHEIEDAGSRAKALRSISEGLANAGMATKALAAAGEIEDAHNRADVLSSISWTLARAGMAAEALAAAGEIEDAHNRADVLMAVAEFWLDQGQDDEALNLLEEAQGAVSKVFDEKQRSEMMRRLAVILARLHSYRAARETAEQCYTYEDRLVAYTAILREYYIERDPSLARLFAEEEEDED